jgi:hypothetical protein
MGLVHCLGCGITSKALFGIITLAILYLIGRITQGTHFIIPLYIVPKFSSFMHVAGNFISNLQMLFKSSVTV